MGKRSREELDSRAGDGAPAPPKKKPANINPSTLPLQTRLTHDMNRPSVLVELGAPDFAARFRALWTEHVEGFKGLARRVKTQKDLEMEWRVRLKQKREALAKAHAQSSRGANAAARTELVSGKGNGNGPAKKTKAAPTISAAERQEAIDRYRALVAAKRSKLPS